MSWPAYLFLCFHHDCTKAIRVFVCGCGCGCRLAYFLADRVQFLAQAVHTAGIACTKQYASPAANSQLVLGLLQGPLTDTCFHREGFAGFPDFALLAPVVGPMVILFPPFSFVWDLALRWSLSPGSHHTYRPRRRVMGLPFSPFLLFGTLCLLGTSLRLIGTRLSGKMLLHTWFGHVFRLWLLPCLKTPSSNDWLGPTGRQKRFQGTWSDLSENRKCLVYTYLGYSYSYSLHNRYTDMHQLVLVLLGLDRRQVL